MKLKELVYFGKSGSFTHTVAKRISKSSILVSKSTIQEVVDYVKEDPSRQGVIPIENTSGGMIVDTIDSIVSRTNTLTIQHEYALNIRLHLMVKRSGAIKKIYSHFAPLHHCKNWIKENYPLADCVPVDSTSEAADRASKEKGAAAIAQAVSAQEYGLKIIKRNIGDHPLNITQFYLIGHPSSIKKSAQETSLSITLKDHVGSLQKALAGFAKYKLNLRRIISRPMGGKINRYLFFLSIDAPIGDPLMDKSIALVRKTSEEVRVLGSYPVHAPFET